MDDKIKLVIEIPEKEYKELLKSIEHYEITGVPISDLYLAIKNGTPLPKGHGRLIDADKFLEKVKKDREHEAYLHSWTVDNVLERLDSWYAPTIIEADKENEE